MNYFKSRDTSYQLSSECPADQTLFVSWDESHVLFVNRQQTSLLRSEQSRGFDGKYLLPIPELYVSHIFSSTYGSRQSENIYLELKYSDIHLI